MSHVSDDDNKLQKENENKVEENTDNIDDENKVKTSEENIESDRNNEGPNSNEVREVENLMGKIDLSPSKKEVKEDKEDKEDIEEKEEKEEEKEEEEKEEEEDKEGKNEAVKEDDKTDDQPVEQVPVESHIESTAEHKEHTESTEHKKHESIEHKEHETTDHKEHVENVEHKENVEQVENTDHKVHVEHTDHKVHVEHKEQNNTVKPHSPIKETEHKHEQQTEHKSEHKHEHNPEQEPENENENLKEISHFKEDKGVDDNSNIENLKKNLSRGEEREKTFTTTTETTTAEFDEKVPETKVEEPKDVINLELEVKNIITKKKTSNSFLTIDSKDPNFRENINNAIKGYQDVNKLYNNYLIILFRYF